MIRQLVDPAPRERKKALEYLGKYPDRNEVVQGYLLQLPQAERPLAILLLQKIEQEGRGKSGVAAQVMALIRHPDYQVRSRVFICLGRLQDRFISLPLVDFVGSNPGEEWQLRALECLYLLHDQRVVPGLSLFLRQTDNPLLVRGIIWLLGSLGGKEPLDVIARWAASPEGRIVKSEVILEALALAIASLEEGMAYWEEVKKENPVLDRFFRYSILPEIDPPHFFVYPYPDYLLDQAKARGMGGKEFKKLFYWDRPT